MNENIDLTKILKDCPEGTKLYSTIYGDVKFHHIVTCSAYPIIIKNDNGVFSVTKYGMHIIDYENNAECTLFPSKDQRDWSKFTAPWYKKDNLVNQKFKVGDWIISSALGIANIICVNNDFNEYQLEYIDGKQKFSSIDYVNYEYDKWTINDAKDGDVLALSWLEDKNLFEKIIIFKKYHSEGIKGLYNMPCVEGYGKTFKNGKIAFPDEEVPYYSKTWTCNLHPATKEQRNFLFQKMKDAGYKWNDETKTLEKLIKPKFKVGDWIITPENKVLQITSIEGTSYRFNNKSHYWEIYYCDEQCHPWTIEDAKDGDVLCYKSGWMCIFKAIDNHTNTFSSYCSMSRDKYFFSNGSENHTLDKNFIKAYNGDIYPATKEQCDALMKAMNEAGYEWDVENKELKKLVPNRFDPKTLKPFDKVLVFASGEWQCDFFSHMLSGDIFNKRCMGIGDMNVVIPYNDDTKHLIGTTGEAPRYYKYWED